MIAFEKAIKKPAESAIKDTFHTGHSAKPAREKLSKLKVTAVRNIRGEEEHVRRQFCSNSGDFSAAELSLSSKLSMHDVMHSTSCTFCEKMDVLGKKKLRTWNRPISALDFAIYYLQLL